MEIPFVQAKFYTEVPVISPRKIDLIVMHCAEVPPKAGMADWLMKYCADSDREASWHYAVDCDVVTQSVREEDVAWQAPGANRNGVGVELATFKMPIASDWANPYHQKMLSLAAFLVAGICARRKISPFFVDVQGLLEGRRGITTHREVTMAFPHKASTPPHLDPGPDFPMKPFLDDVVARITSGNFQA